MYSYTVWRKKLLVFISAHIFLSVSFQHFCDICKKNNFAFKMHEEIIAQENVMYVKETKLRDAARNSVLGFTRPT